MLTKNQVKDIQSLYHKKYRADSNLFVAEGPKLAQELLSHESVIQHIYATKEWTQRHQTINVAITEVTEIELSRISKMDTPNEVLVVAHQQKQVDEPVLTGNLTLLLDGIQDPGNLGSIIRTADWFGIDQVICTSDSADIYNPKVVQSSMGSILRIKCWYKEPGEIHLQPLPVFGALLQGESLYNIRKPDEGILIIGNEGRGIREPLLPLVTHPITIPKKGNAESLNAAIATGVILSWLTVSSQ